MESRDGKFGFDFGGVYDAVEPYRMIEYTIDDGRKVSILFEGVHVGSRITETFEAESENSIELQRAGWQAIMDSYKRYVEKQ